jgi:hypothetical protein
MILVMINALLGVEPNVHADPLWPDVPSDHWAMAIFRPYMGEGVNINV